MDFGFAFGLQNQRKRGLPQTQADLHGCLVFFEGASFLVVSKGNHKDNHHFGAESRAEWAEKGKIPDLPQGQVQPLVL